MNTQLPYNIHSQGNSYHFETDRGVYYKVEFIDGSFYFAEFPTYLAVFEFSYATA